MVLQPRPCGLLCRQRTVPRAVMRWHMPSTGVVHAATVHTSTANHNTEDSDSDSSVFNVTEEEARIAATVEQPIDWADVRRMERMLGPRPPRPANAPTQRVVRRTEEDVWLAAGAPGYEHLVDKKAETNDQGER